MSIDVRRLDEFGDALTEDARRALAELAAADLDDEITEAALHAAIEDEGDDDEVFRALFRDEAAFRAAIGGEMSPSGLAILRALCDDEDDDVIAHDQVAS